MKKVIAIAAALTMALALAACASNAPSSQSAGSDESSSAGLANPWQQADSPEAAAEGAGLGPLQLPAEGTTIEGSEIHWSSYQYMNLLAEADGSVGSADLTVRKGAKNPAETPAYDPSDVSGDYNEYAFSWEVEAADWPVKCWGNEDGRMMKATWTSDNFSYSIMVRGQGDIADTYGLGADDVIALVNAIA